MKNLADIFESFLDKRNKKTTQFRPESILTMYEKEFGADSHDYKMTKKRIERGNFDIASKTLTTKTSHISSSAVYLAQKYGSVNTLDATNYAGVEIDICGDYPYLEGFTFLKRAELHNHFTSNKDKLEIKDCDFKEGVDLSYGGVSQGAEFTFKNCKINKFFRAWEKRTYKFEGCSGHVSRFIINTYSDTCKEYKDALIKQIKDICKGKGKVEDICPGLTTDEIEIGIWAEKGRSQSRTNTSIIITKQNPYAGRTRADCMYNIMQPYKIGNWYIQWYSWKMNTRKRANKFPVALVKFVEPMQLPTT